jgi:hypothetical protein
MTKFLGLLGLGQKFALVFKDFVDSDPDLESGSGSRGKKNEEKNEKKEIYKVPSSKLEVCLTFNVDC